LPEAYREALRLRPDDVAQTGLAAVLIDVNQPRP
jgi:hypothetical protein